MVTATAIGSKLPPPGPLDDEGYRFLPSRLSSQLIILPRLMRNPPEYFVQVAQRYGAVVTLSPNRFYLVTGLTA
jgi:hypothetical protein